MRRGDDRRLAAIVGVSLARRRALSWLVVPAAALASPGLAWSNAGRLASSRVWPAQEYTRLILEARVPLAHRMTALRNPDRLLIELDDVDMTPELAALASRVHSGDPYLAGIRVGRSGTTGVRIVLDLKAEVNPQIFALPPIAEYGHRLVIDLYPAVPIDPLMAFLREREEANREAARADAPRLPEPRVAEAPKSGADRIPPDRGDAPGTPKPEAGARVPARRGITIAIDPGHGGEDPGAIGRRGTYEKHVALAIGRRLKSLIDRETGMRAMLTRDDDYFVPLAQRVQKARRVQADLFVSIHADAFREARARGSSVFALSETGATSAAARWLAKKENEADLIGGVNLDARDPVLARTLLDLSQTAQIADSLKVGRHVLAEIGEHNALHKASVEQAGFAVLKAPDIPSILVETAFISNPDEELKLRSERHQQKFAESIGDGIKRYFASNPPLARSRSA